MTSSAAPTVFLDCETTSIRHDREVWEIGLIRRTPDQGPGEGAPWTMFLPVTLQDADRFSLNVGGFYQRHPYGRYLSGLDDHCVPALLPGADDAALWRQVGRLLHGSLIVGAVPSFDETAIDVPLRAADVLPAHDYHLIDVGTLVAGYLAGQGRAVPPPPWRSGDLAQLVGVRPTPEAERHQALADAAFAMRIYDRVVHHYDDGYDAQAEQDALAGGSDADAAAEAEEAHASGGTR